MGSTGDSTRHEGKGDVREDCVTRRGFVRIAGGLGAAVAVMAPGLASAKEAASSAADAPADLSSVTGDTPADDAALAEVYDSPKWGHAPILAPATYKNFNLEKSVPDPKSLDELGLKPRYDCDVLVIGGGLAGMYAARRAQELGKSVILVDKGTVGKSGQSPWAHTFAFLDPDYDDQSKYDYYVQSTMQDSEYICNTHYYEMYMDHSKEIYEDALDWGWLHPHDWSTTETTDKTPAQMLQEHADIDRRLIWHQGMVDTGIEMLERVMMVDLIKDGDAVVGAVGFPLDGNEVITIVAKSVILATGQGSVRPCGFPTGSSSWDGDGMAYRAGAAISGKEFTDFHWTLADVPGDVYSMFWRSFEEGQIFFTPHYQTYNDMMNDVFEVDANGGFQTPDRSRVEDIVAGDAASVAAITDNPNDVRTGLASGAITPDFLWLNREVKEAAIGMGGAKSEGIFPADDTCWTGVKGLWAAGDALCSYMYGSIGLTMGAISVASCVQGRVSAEQACAYCDTVDAPAPSDDVIKPLADGVLAPLNRDRGFSPSWVEELLCNVIAPYWVSYMKDDDTLNTALSSLLEIKKKCLGNLRARNPHELRYCHEMDNKLLSMEAKLRASLMRTESRGLHYRSDYPFRDDKNWLAWITERQGDDGEMVLEKVDEPDEFKGDLTESYTDRYPYRMPGELEALGIEDPAADSSTADAPAAAAPAGA